VYGLRLWRVVKPRPGSRTPPNIRRSSESSFRGNEDNSAGGKAARRGDAGLVPDAVSLSRFMFLP
jgi:hypothetical protein